MDNGINNTSKKTTIKAYITNGTASGMDNIDGTYNLVLETGECLYGHLCSNKYFAKGDLYENRPERKKELAERYTSVEVLYLGEDDMTQEVLLARNKEWYKQNANDQ